VANTQSRDVNLTKRVLTPKGLRYCPVVLAANGRVRPDFVLVDGQPERHPKVLITSNGARKAGASGAGFPSLCDSPGPCFGRRTKVLSRSRSYNLIFDSSRFSKVEMREL
jgi:hypothetical protein